MTVVFQVRPIGDDDNRIRWCVTERGDDSPLMGPNRVGEHVGCTFDTMADAAHAARWRVERLEDGDGRVERGPTW